MPTADRGRPADGVRPVRGLPPPATGPRPPAAEPSPSTHEPPGAAAAPPPPAPLPTGSPTRLPIPPLLVDLAGWTWRLVLLGGAAWLLLRVAERLYLVVLPLAGSLLLTALLSPVAAALRRRGLPRVAATALTIVLFLAVLGGVLAWVVQRAIDGYPDLVNQLRDAVERLPLHTATVRNWRQEVLTWLQQHQSSVAKGVLSGVLTAGEVLTGLLLTLLLTVILLGDGPRIWDWIVRRFPDPAYQGLHDAGGRAYGRLSGWIRGTFIIAVFHSAVVAIALLALGVPLVAPLAVLVFFGSFIPIVGALLFGGLAALVTFATQGLGAAIVLVVVLLVDNQIEAHALQPFLVGRYVRLHPFAVALAITAGGLLAGLAGAFLAVPLTAALSAALSPAATPPPKSRLPRLRRRTTPPAG